MEAVDSLRKLKENKSRKKKKEENVEMRSSLPAERDGNVVKARAKNMNKKRSDDISNKVDAKQMKRRKRKIGKRVKSGKDETDTPNSNVIEDRTSGKKDAANEAKDRLQDSRQKEWKSIEGVKADTFNEVEDAFERQNDEETSLRTKLESKDHDTSSVEPDGADTRSCKFNGKPKMSAKMKKKRKLLGKESSQDDLLEKKGSVADDLLEKKGNAADDEVDQMSSGDEDYSKGMRKWVLQYHQSRPGIKVLQERIDDFITAQEAQEDQAREEREAQAAEGGWTVVVHRKGGKKTTDAESGTAVGAVAQAAVLDKMAKKKSKEVGLDFYRFQRREAHRNEIMMLQNKFEQDKKRIQEMRAARKFRPY